MKKIILLLCIGLGYLMADFTRDNTTKIVTDNDTCLEWSDHEIVVMNFSSAIDYCENLVLGGKDDWRLPNYNELLTIMDISTHHPSISNKFIEIRQDAYWSSTSFFPDNTKAWVINFERGDTHERSLTDGGITVRCVRTK